MYYLVIPILNDISLIRGPLFAISTDIVIEKLTDEEHSAFYRMERNLEIRDYLAINGTKCIKQVFDREPTEEQVRIEGIKLSFLLNIFSSNHPVIIQWAAVLEGTNKLNIRRIQEFDTVINIQDFSRRSYRIKPGITRQAIFETYRTINHAIANDRNAEFTIRRFNSSLLRPDFNDKLIDTTICLESLISGTIELSFRFSLYLSFISKEVAQERAECFQKLKDLYDVRSKVVHGEVDQAVSNKIRTIEENWEYYHEVLRSALIYYLIYISGHTRNQWKSHLQNIVLGSENKITV